MVNDENFCNAERHNAGLEKMLDAGSDDIGVEHQPSGCGRHGIWKR